MPKARILAVDDQLYFRVFLEDLLNQEGYEVCTASGGEEALHLFERGDFDVVLTDLVMPGMDGTQLVGRVKELRPDQDVVVITSVGDVKTAVEAMKLGATDYLLKPIDRTVLARALEGLLQRRRLREEHGRLMAENLEFMGAFSLYERGLGLFGTLSIEVLADRIVEGLCLETHAHGGVLWLARDGEPQQLRLAAVRGLVRPDEEPEELSLEALPPELELLAEPLSHSFLAHSRAASGDEEKDAAEGRTAPLWVPLRRGAQLFGAARVTDRLDGGEFGDDQRAVAEKFAVFAAQAVDNALRFRALERRSFRDPVTKTYTRAYFDDVTHNEIRKAARFGRTFSLVRIELEGLGELRGRASEAEFVTWVESLAFHVGRALRATDLLAAESESRFCVLLPETDSVGAAVLKRRMRASIERSEPWRALEPSERPELLLGAATFPTDGTQLEALWSVLEGRVDEDRRSLVRSLELESMPFRGLVDALLAEGIGGRPETGEQMTRYLIEEVARRPHERGLLFVAPGAGMAGALRDGLETLRGLSPRTEIVLVAERKGAPVSGLPVTWVSPLRSGTQSPFLIYFGEGAPYALLRDPAGEDGRVTIFHSCDRVLVEHLTFQLGRDLGIPVGE
jgi:CheY-like chemotaxis protein/GGDEF domain-containing protein